MPEKILVVDDDPDILDAVTMILESQGYELVTARDGIEGLANLKAEQPDLIILDLRMPEMDGFAVIKVLKMDRETENIPVIVLTGHDMKGYKEKSHPCLAIGLEKLFSDKIEAKHFSRLKDCMEMRHDADYGHIFSDVTAKELVIWAKEFLEVAQKIIGEVKT